MQQCRIAIGLLLGASAFGQPAGANYDESKVGAYTLPDPLARTAQGDFVLPAQGTARAGDPGK